MIADLEANAEISKPVAAISAYMTSLEILIGWLSVVIAVRRSTMTTLIEIVCSVSQEEAAQATVEAFCKETGSRLIGRCVNEETHEVQLMVLLPHHTAKASRHAAALGHALQEQVIASFRYITSDLVKISFDPSVDLREQMRNFPLRPGESWFPAIHDLHQAYICMSRPLMLTEQAAWLLEQKVQWAFV